jgi:c-di-GMP-binding flagellar brake protein YcgR
LNSQEAILNRREYFRLSFATLIGTMQIIEIGRRPITTTPRSVSILDVSGGGICVQGDEDLPIRRGVVGQYVFAISSQNFVFRGTVVRKVDDRVTYEYGVRFIDVDEVQRSLLVSILGRLQVEQSRRIGG